MGKSERRKGRRAEKELAKILGGERVPLSGAARGQFGGDVVALGIVWEAKVRKSGFKQLYGWLEKGDADALAIRADRKGWLAVVPLDTLLSLLDQ